MTPDYFERDLDQWLNIAVRQLQPTEQQIVRRELANHYADAIERYLATGITKLDAHHAAMRDLGDPQKTAEGMRHVYPSSGRYLTAALLSQGFAFMIIGKLLLERLPGTESILAMFSFLVLLCQPPCLIFILHSFKRLASPTGFLDRPVTVFSWLLAIWDIIFFVGASFEDTPLPPWLSFALSLCLVVTTISLALNLIWFGLRLSKFHIESNRPQEPLAYLSILSGMTVLVLTAMLVVKEFAMTLNSRLSRWLPYLTDLPIAAGIVLYSICGAYLTWRFIRASRRPDALSSIYGESN